MNDAFVNFHNNLITKKHLSFYNKNDIEILNEYRTVVPIGILEEIVPELIELDIKKAFTYALTLIKEIPLFNEFDIFKEYKNEDIKPLNLYIVTSPIGNLFMNKKYNLVYGKFLINFKDIEILFYKEPANIIS